MKIGGTPFEKVDIGQNINVFVKLESYNFSGSVKARMAHYMLLDAFKKNQIKKGDAIIEATTGNTGIAFSALANKFDLKMIAIMPEDQSIERIQLMQAYGAEVLLTPASEGPNGAIKRRDLLKSKTQNSWTPNQFSSYVNIDAYQHGLGLEIILDLQKYKIEPNYLVHGIGTGGTLMGVAEVLTRVYPKIKIVAVEPDELPALSNKGVVKGTHGIQGIGEGFIPKIVDMEKIDMIERVHTGSAIKEMKTTIRKTGISMGISSGANISAIKQIFKKSNQKDSIFVTIFADGIDRYLSLIK